jgi:hypothetical protein
MCGVLQCWFVLLAMALVAGVSRILTDFGAINGESKIDMSGRVLLNSRVASRPALPTDSGSIQSKMLLLSLVGGAYVAMTSAAWSVLARKKLSGARSKSAMDDSGSNHSTPSESSHNIAPSPVSLSPISSSKKKQHLNMAAEIRTYVRTLGAHVIRSYQKLKVELHQAGLNETDEALEFARRHFAVENFDASALPAHIDPVEFCRCVQGPILDRQRKHSFLAPDSFYPHSWMPHGFGTAEGPWTGAHLPGVGKRLASAIITHFKLDASTSAGLAKVPSVVCPVQPSPPLPMLLREVLLALPEQRNRALGMMPELLQPIWQQTSLVGNGRDGKTAESFPLLVCVLLVKPTHSAAHFWSRHMSTLLPHQSSADGDSYMQWGMLHALSTRPRFTPEHLQQCIDEGIHAILAAQVRPEAALQYAHLHCPFPRPAAAMSACVSCADRAVAGVRRAVSRNGAQRPRTARTGQDAAVYEAERNRGTDTARTAGAPTQTQRGAVALALALRCIGPQIPPPTR